MERQYGTEGISLVECINRRLGKWRVRWDVQPDGEGDDSHGVSFVEVEFGRKPALADVATAITGSGVEASMTELVAISGMLDGDATAFLKDMAVEKILRHDSSPAVNSFTLAGTRMWLDKATRVGLANSVNIEKAAGKDMTMLWFDGVQYGIPVDSALRMLAALELYALDCYNVTQAHIAAVRLLDEMEALEGYDYTSGYPEKLVFNL